MDENKNDEYKLYTIILTVVHDGNLNQLQLKVLCNDIEAYRLSKNLSEKIEKLAMNQSVGLSMSCRNENGKIVFHGISGIVSIEHDIPEFLLVDEE